MTSDGDEYADLPVLSKEQLVEAAYEVTGGNLTDLSLDQLARTFTVATHVFDLCLNEIERRGVIAKREDGVVIIPYCSNHSVETALTRLGKKS
jgi:hypothetical protein